MTSSESFGQIMHVTPEMASRWLEGNTHNRRINQTHVNRLAEEMKAGRWRLTHQGIAFSASGTLLDGQHRLWAIVLSGATVKVRVFFNEPAGNEGAIDGGLSRSDADRLTLTGKFEGGVSRNHLAALRVMLRGLKEPTCIGIAVLEAEMVKHKGAIDFALGNLASDHSRGVANSVTRGVLARAFYSTDRDKLTHFCDVLKTGLSGEADQPIILLRDYLGKCPRSRKANILAEQYAKTERALLAYLRGERLSKLYAGTFELFPLPGEEV
jgi:hypothetical protein